MSSYVIGIFCIVDNLDVVKYHNMLLDRNGETYVLFEFM